MITPNEIQLTYREATIRIVVQPKHVVVDWEFKLDGSVGHVQLSRTSWADGEVVRLVMETIDRCYKQYQRTMTQRRS